jgi:hypothetical protein
MSVAALTLLVQERCCNLSAFHTSFLTETFLVAITFAYDVLPSHELFWEFLMRKAQSYSVFSTSVTTHQSHSSLIVRRDKNKCERLLLLGGSKLEAPKREQESKEKQKDGKRRFCSDCRKDRLLFSIFGMYVMESRTERFPKQQRKARNSGGKKISCLSKRAKAKCLKHSTSDDKHSFFFPSNPLDNLLCRFGHSLSTRPSARNAIKLIFLGFPPERNCIFRTSIVHLKMGCSVVDSSVQSRIQGYQTAMGYERGKVWVERGSEELDVRARFVDEVEEG